MRAWVYTQSGLPSQTLTQTTVSAPTASDLGPHDVLVEVHYVSLNAICTAMMRALPPQPFSLGLPFRSRSAIPEFEFAGRILATGSQVPAARPELSPDTQILGCVSEQQVFGSGKGALAERLVVPASQIIPLISPELKSSDPETAPEPPVSLLEGSGLTACGCTAIQTVDATRLIAGDKLFVNGGSTSVGMLTLQVARHVLGPTGTIVASCSAANAPLLRSLGADEVVDYTAHDPLHAYLRAHHAARPFDAIVDCVGDPEIYAHCVPYLAEGKPFINLGQMKATPGFWGQIAWAWTQFATRYWPVVLGGVPRAYQFYGGKPTVESMQRIMRLVEKGVVRVVVDSVWRMGEVRKAYERMESKRAKGKIVVSVRE
ncbi:NAD(P)-dependent alcohol dehydrogenase, partial [Aspergillus homomorphus CBS 101889]